MIETYFDNFGNMATIVKKNILPYKEARHKKTAYILTAYSLYNEKMIYHLSVYDCKNEALKALNLLSAGTFKK